MLSLNNIISFIGLLGSIASIIGIWFTYKQVKAVEDVAKATKDVTEKTQKTFVKTLAIVEVSKYWELISTIQQTINSDEINYAIHLCHELKSALIELQEAIPIYNCKSDTSFDLTAHIQSLGIHITNMHKALPDKKNKLHKNKIIEDLEIIHNQMSKILALQKTKTS